MTTAATRTEPPLLDDDVDATPVCLDGSALESTAPSYLRTIKTSLDADGQVPVTIHYDATADETGSIEALDEVDRVRELIAAAAFLGSARVVVEWNQQAASAAVDAALEACRERAESVGVTFELKGRSTVA